MSILLNEMQTQHSQEGSLQSWVYKPWHLDWQALLLLLQGNFRLPFIKSICQQNHLWKVKQAIVRGT